MKVFLLLAWAALLPATARTITVVLPEISWDTSVIRVAPWVGIFFFELQPRELIRSAELQGAFGNRRGGTHPLTGVFADEILVAEYPTGPHVTVFPLPWRYVFSDHQLHTLADGKLDLDVRLMGPYERTLLRLAETRLTIETEELPGVPEPASAILTFASLTIALGSREWLSKAAMFATAAPVSPPKTFHDHSSTREKYLHDSPARRVASV